MTGPAPNAMRAAVPAFVPEEVVTQAKTLGVALDGELGEQLARFLELLLTTNQSFNLTAITDRHEAWHKHVLDSLTLVESLSARPDLRSIVDVGSGGGLPAIPLALALPDRSFTLLEATGKKARFLEEAARTLNLANVQVVETRAETYGRSLGRERFDAATARAVARLPVLLELTLPLVRRGGVCFALKGAQAAQETQEAHRALALLGGQVSSLRRTDTGTILTIEKVGATPAKYPRKPGEPKRMPL